MRPPLLSFVRAMRGGAEHSGSAARARAQSPVCRRRVRLREIWGEDVVVTTFLRQFGCLFCHRAIAEIVAIVPDVIAAGARLVFVGNGSVNQAQRFYAEKKLPRDGCTVVTDP